MEWKDWSYVLFSERHRLPDCSGIYVIADAIDRVWYVGQAENLRSRWAGRGHHRYPQLIRSNRKLCHKIYWKQVQASSLDEQEKYYINLFRPELNGCKVKKYLPQKPQVEREIKRLLKVLNKLTSLFPTIRSVVLGEYEGDDGVRCIVIARNGNDYQIIYNSMKKRYDAEVRRAWIENKTYCGKSEQDYREKDIPTYSVNGYRFEFVEAWEFLQYLGKNSRYLGDIELLGVEVKALRNLSILNEFPFVESWGSSYSDGKKPLKDGAYINYRKSMLKCVVG